MSYCIDTNVLITAALSFGEELACADPLELLKKYFMNRREITYLLETRCVCTNKIVHQLIYVNQNHPAQAITAVQNGTLGRTC